MNEGLAELRAWAGKRAGADPDLSARPLWRQIRDEVGAYLDGDGPPTEQTGPDLFATEDKP